MAGNSMKPDAIDDLRAFARAVEVDAAVREGLRRYDERGGPIRLMGIRYWAKTWIEYDFVSALQAGLILTAWREAHP